ncbi:kinesin family protein-like protein [Xylogone sp. PMI_703]|nr:kinesin family protein-like protein [Xylogone sp. PMI_703]
MDHSSKSQSALFQVYLRLRPPPAGNTDSQSRFLTVEEDAEGGAPTHITLNPPNDSRRRAVEKFGFTRVFEEDATQIDLLQGSGVLGLVEGVLGSQGGDGRDGLLATLGVTGSGKSHTILGSKTQRGLTQLSLDVLFRSLGSNILDTNTTTSLHASVAASDPSEAQVMSAPQFLDTIYGDGSAPSRASSRATTPMVVRIPEFPIHPSSLGLYPSLVGLNTGSPKSIRVVKDDPVVPVVSTLPQVPSFMLSTLSKARKHVTKTIIKGDLPKRQPLQRPSGLPPIVPDVSDIIVDCDTSAEYAVVISMYEVYNDRIFDLLTPAIRSTSTKEFRRRPLLFKPTEQSPDRKVVAGLRKVICNTAKDALLVLEAGLHERRVAGTGSNSVSSRSHGFFCVEVKKRQRSRAPMPWTTNTFTIVDLAGSERARDAKTQGATLAEAGKINESLMYLGQCLQMQSDLVNSTKPNLVPFRQCKLTELLFSNSFPSPNLSASHNHHPRNPQRATMIVTADPVGDFNATSQILRYSALAREITVPRIPSVTSTILAQSTAGSAKSYCSSDRGDTEREAMEIAAIEIARMSEEIDGLRNELESEQQKRMECESHLLSMEDRLLDLESEIREECYQEMEKRMQEEMARWKATWATEVDRNEEHMDKKIEIYTRGIELDIDEDKENIHSGYNPDTASLQDENERLRKEVELLRRQLEGNASPTKSRRLPLRESRTTSDVVKEMANLSINDSTTKNVRSTRSSKIGTPELARAQGSPVKRVRKLGTKKWDLCEDDDLM